MYKATISSFSIVYFSELYIMNTAHGEDQLEHILQQCFPNAGKIKILENSANEIHKSVVSKIIDLTVEYEEDGEPYKKFLIMKAPVTGQVTSFFDDLEMFTREIFLYDTIIPRMNSYLDVSLMPFCHKTINSKILVLENLVASKYERLDGNRLHLKECLPIIEALAHFHAASYKVGQNDPALFYKTALHISPVLELRQKMAIYWEPVLVELLRLNNELSLIPKFKNIMAYLRREDDEVASKIRYSQFDFFVLNHGDYRNENILLKYDSNGTVDGVKIVDFQTCFWSTPIHDFIYFLIMSARVEVFENHFDTLLYWYLERLNEKLKTLDCSTIYTKSNFLDDLKTLNFCCIIFTLASAVAEYPLDRASLVDDMLQKNMENIEACIETCTKNELFIRQIVGILKLCDKLGLLDSSPEVAGIGSC